MFKTIKKVGRYGHRQKQTLQGTIGKGLQSVYRKANDNERSGRLHRRNA